MNTSMSTPAQALRDAVWQKGASIGHYKAAHSALTRELGLDFDKTADIVGRILSDLRRNVGADYERVVDYVLNEADRLDAEHTPAAHHAGGCNDLCQGDGHYLLPSTPDAEHAPTPGTRQVTVTVYDNEPGPEVANEVECNDGEVWKREGARWKHRYDISHRWDYLSKVYGPMRPVGTRDRLRGVETDQ